MGPQGARKPGSIERRYSALSEQRKTLYYAFRRHLGMSRAEVDALPWWEHRFLVEKMNEEFAPPGELDGDQLDIGEVQPMDRTFDNAEAMGFTVHAV